MMLSVGSSQGLEDFLKANIRNFVYARLRLAERGCGSSFVENKDGELTDW